MLKVNEIFHSIQTEGPFTGTPAVFIRLAGCNLSCLFCDTDHETVNLHITDEELVEMVITDYPSPRLVVITGGEPFLQDFSRLADTLSDCGYNIQVETNGTVQPDENFDSNLLYEMYIVCSPKQDIQEDIWHYLNAIKLLCNENSQLQQILTLKQTCIDRHVDLFLQPEMGDTREKENIQYTVELCKLTDVKFSLQYHKLINIL